MAPIFVATSGGVVFESGDAASTDRKKNHKHDNKSVRNRLAVKLAKQREEAEAANNTSISSKRTEEISSAVALNVETQEIARIEDQLRTDLRDRQVLRDQAEDNKLLARLAADKKGNSKAIPSQYVYKPDAADNAAKRAIVHHTGSHYHMAGSRQFQRGVRVKGVVSRHSTQGAKLQAARVAKNNGFAAREDARGERTQGGGKGQGKSSKKKKNRSEK
mmetsp:Transcript_2870/g.4627  ORF Transcript_2870/g.4627 Transcript_2870/m.4627 type:complete len:218 (-) Transcript_2870:572-1225(-)